MSTFAGDFWVCGDCRSINNAGARQCYNCRTPTRSRGGRSRARSTRRRHGKLRRIELPAFRIIALGGGPGVDPDPRGRRDAGRPVQPRGDSCSIRRDGHRRRRADSQYRRQRRDRRVRDRAARAHRLVAVAEPDRDVDAGARAGLSGRERDDGVRRELHPDPEPVPRPGDRPRRRPPARTRGAGRGEALIFAAWIGLLGGYLVPRVLCVVHARPRHRSSRSPGSARAWSWSGRSSWSC